MKTARIQGDTGVGHFSVLFEVANYGDLVLMQRGMLRPEKVRRLSISGVVDTGAAKLVLPQGVVRELDLPLGDRIQVRYADGRRVQRREAQGVYVALLGRQGTFTAIVEPKRKDALIGAIVLEDLDLLVDCQHQRLLPRDPKGPVFAVE